MKNVTTTRLFISGLVSTMLFAVGLTHAAQKLDPVSSKSGVISTFEMGDFTAGCTAPCLAPADIKSADVTVSNLS